MSVKTVLACVATACVATGLILAVGIIFMLDLDKAFRSEPEPDYTWTRRLQLMPHIYRPPLQRFLDAVPAEVTEGLLAFYDRVDGVQRLTRVMCEAPYRESYQFFAVKDGEKVGGIYCFAEKQRTPLNTQEWVPTSVGLILTERTFP